MSKSKRCKIERGSPVHSLYDIISIVGDEYFNDIDRGLLKFVNRQFYEKYKKYNVDLNMLMINPIYFRTPSYWNYVRWYEKFTGNKFNKLAFNEKLIIKYDYHNIYDIYYCSPSLTRRLFDVDDYTYHIVLMIKNNAYKCIKFMLGCHKGLVVKSLYHIAKTVNKIMFKYIMDYANNNNINIHKYISINHLMNNCIDSHNENILESIIDEYRYEPSESIIKRVNGPHFNCRLCQAIVEKIGK